MIIQEALKERIKELRSLAEEVTTSDLQGIAEAIAKEILNPDKNSIDRLLIEEILLNYAYKEIDFNKCLEELEVLK